uniref:Uncharacterized protein n=1 Tax=Arundo donax TaxID=35708 RepID=A0A0A9EQ46_ARUDO
MKSRRKHLVRFTIHFQLVLSAFFPLVPNHSRQPYNDNLRNAGILYIVSGKKTEVLQ